MRRAERQTLGPPCDAVGVPAKLGSLAAALLAQFIFGLGHPLQAARARIRDTAATCSGLSGLRSAAGRRRAQAASALRP